MFFIIFLYIFVIVGASANNVMPAQTYTIYQQNGYTNQPSNTHPYNQGVMNQNQLQQLNISPSLIKQAVLNKLFANPSAQTILDPSVTSYGLNMDAVGQVPVNLISNYPLPTEITKDNTNYGNVERKTSKSSERDKHHKRKSKSRRKHKETNKGDDKLIVNNDLSSNVPENARKSRKDSSNLNPQTHEDNGKNKKKKRRKSKHKEQTTENPVQDVIKVENGKSRKHRKKEKVNETVVLENEVKTATPKEINNNVHLDITGDAMDNENRLTRNLKQDTNNDPHITKPVTPKEVTNSLLTNLNQFNNPLMSNWFANYENLYQSMLTNHANSEIKPKRRRKLKKNKTPKRKGIKKATNTTTVTPKVITIDTTTEKVIYHQETEFNLKPDPTEEVPQLTGVEVTTRKEFSNEISNDGYNMDEFQENDDEGFYEGYIDDYYPLFTDNAAYNANNKEIILKNLSDDKYYYAMDQFVPEYDQNIENYEYFATLNNTNLETKLFINEEINKNTTKIIEDEFPEEILPFRSPPVLETPDFETKPIDKQKIKKEIYYIHDLDKLEGKSTYASNAKPSYSISNKPNEINLKSKDVETIYARSKAVSYGPVYTPEYSLPQLNDDDYPWINYGVLSDTFQDGDTTYVVAKSLDS